MTVGGILRGTWQFIRANLPAIAVWGAINLLMGILLRVGMTPLYQARLEAAARTAQGLSSPLPPFGPFLAVWLLVMAMLLVLTAAVFRAVLFPEQRRAFYLRIGMDEARLLGLVAIGFVAAIAVGLVIAVASLVFALLGGMVLGLGRGSAGLIVVSLVLLLWVAMFYVSVRLSLIGPLTVARRRLVIREGWQLARGRFWRLLGAYLVIWLVIFVGSLALVLPQMGAMFAAIGRPGDPAAQIELARVEVAQMSLSSSPAHLLLLLVGSFVGMIFYVLLAAAPAVAVRQLLDERAGLA